MLAKQPTCTSAKGTSRVGAPSSVLLGNGRAMGLATRDLSLWRVCLQWAPTAIGGAAPLSALLSAEGAAEWAGNSSDKGAGSPVLPANGSFFDVNVLHRYTNQQFSAS